MFVIYQYTPDGRLVVGRDLGGPFDNLPAANDARDALVAEDPESTYEIAAL